MADAVLDGAGNVIIPASRAGSRGMDPQTPLYTRDSGTGAAAAAGGNSPNGFAPAQTSPATVVFVPGNTAGPAGSNATATQVVPANPNRTFLEIINNGPADVELWMPNRPADADVNQAVKKGIVVAANGGGRSYDARAPLSAIYATTTAVGGLSVIEG